MPQEYPDYFFDDEYVVKEDINSLSVVNQNLYVKSDYELGQEASRVLKWWFDCNGLNRDRPGRYFSQQMNCLKDLLVKYRTEQVVAAVKYYTLVNPPNKGMHSIVFLKYKRNVMKALDYYKGLYLEQQKERKMELAGEKQKEKTKKKTDEEFLDSYFGKMSGIRIGGRSDE